MIFDGFSGGEDKRWPLIHPFEPDRPAFWTASGLLSQGRIAERAAALAASLLDCPFAINYCEARDRFAVGLLAALSRDQTAVFPPDRTERSFSMLRADMPDVYCLSDSTLPATDSVHVSVSDDASGGSHGAADLSRIALERTAVKVFTSGSTGRPSGSDKTWAMLVAGAKRIPELIGMADHPHPSIVATVPSQHMYGFEHSVMYVLQGRASAHVERPVYPADIARCLSEVPAPRVLVTTPVHLRTLVEHGGALPKIERIVSATAPLSEDLAGAAERCLEAPVFEIYGFTEAGSVAGRGTPAGPGWALRQDFAARQADGRQYVEWQDFGQHIPFPDVVEILDPRRIRLHGRSEDMINVAGKRASLNGLTAQLLEVDGVKDGVFWLPSEDLGLGLVARLIAFVVAPNSTPDRIRRELSRRMDPAFVPRTIIPVDALPRNATGKLPQESLRKIAASHLKSRGNS